jgi:hypothetical protein
MHFINIILYTSSFEHRNNFGSYIYMGFIQEFESFAVLFGGPNGCSKGCVHYLGTQLFYVFVFKLIGGNVMELASKKIMNIYYKCRGGKQIPQALGENGGKYLNIDENKVTVVYPKDEGINIYESKNVALDFCEQSMYTIEERTGDYMELAILFGYTSLFVIASPLIVPLAFISVLFESQVDAEKLKSNYLRPMRT